jgi:hypothetical protein
MNFRLGIRGLAAIADALRDDGGISLAEGRAARLHELTRVTSKLGADQTI